MKTESVKVEFAKELDKATVLIVGCKYLDGEQQKVVRLFKAEDLNMDAKVNDVGTDIEVNRNIFFSNKHICELVFYHNESIDALIHRLEEIKKM